MLQPNGLLPLCLQRLVHHGRNIAPSSTLAAASLANCSTLELVPRLCGGGGDGGSTGAESRSSYLEMYMAKKPDKVDPGEERLARWSTCHLSGMPLHPPCVCDVLGNVYNKDAVVQALVAKTMPKGLAYISSLKHLVDLKLERAAGVAKGDAVQFACPVTGALLNGKARFVVVRRGGQGPGVVLSERALKEVPAVVKELVGGEWAKDDLLVLNPQGEELLQLSMALAAKMEAERAAKREKKAAKAGSKRAAAPEETAATAANGSSRGGAKTSKTAEKMAPAHADKGVWNSLFTSSKGNAGHCNGDFMLRGSHRLQ